MQALVAGFGRVVCTICGPLGSRNSESVLFDNILFNK